MVNAGSPKKRKSTIGGVETPNVNTKKVKTDISLTQTPGKTQKTPIKNPQPQSGKKNKIASQSPQNQPQSAKKQKTGNADGSSQKVKPFAGTKELNGQKQKGKGKQTPEATSGPVGEKKKKKGHFFHLQENVKTKGKETVLAEIEEKLKAIESRGELTKTAKRKLKLLKKIKRVAITGESPVTGKPQKGPNPQYDGLSASQKRRLKKKLAKQNFDSKTTDDKKKQKQPKAEKTKVPAQTQQAKQGVKPTKVVPKVPKVAKMEVDDSEESSSESDYDPEEALKAGLKVAPIAQPESDEDDDDDDGEGGIEEADVEESGEEESGEEESGDEEESDGEEEAEEEEGSSDELVIADGANEAGASDESDDEEGDEESSEEEEEVPKLVPAKVQTQQQPSKPGGNPDANKKRFVLFAGNLPFDASKQEITDHFKKIGKIRDVRVPTDQKTNRPRGFAYVEVENAESYEKGLSMHHSILKGRRINVQYSESGKKKSDNQKSHMKQKNMKFDSMRKKGQLAGSVKENQKRSVRRNMAKKAKVNGDS